MQDSAQSINYKPVYDLLADLRESFHRSGRLDDSNAKLDEIAKLFATYLAFRRDLIPYFPRSTEPDLVPRLQEAFLIAARLPQYIGASGRSIFGERPALQLRADDRELAIDLINLVRECVDLAYSERLDGRPFDILNEAFGHFVRDNFRGNVEDAQYMTPPEVVDFIVDVALHDLKSENDEKDSHHWTVMDPTCGVGSFLTSFHNRARVANWPPLEKVRLIGQDKVERMARLATINMELFDAEEHIITVGNSLTEGSSLDAFKGKVDLILTNPPFGARFSGDEVLELCGENTPFFSSLKRISPTIDSELLFIDRNVDLLREGGALMIVVPDGVVSARGMAAMLRHHLSGRVTVRAVVELPSVTFAQAGTRTKTSILYLKKGRNKSESSNIFMSVVTDLGFQVSSRKGVLFKKIEGVNELPFVLEAYQKFRSDAEQSQTLQVLSRQPSCVGVPEYDVFRSSWTPSHYSAKRFDAVLSIEKAGDFKLAPLGDLVDFCADSRRNLKWEPGMAFLSILHVLGEGFVDIRAMQTYAPKTPGVPISAGEILLSRINPRIPRVCIAPALGKTTLCSSEFEVMTPKEGYDPFMLTYLLLTDVVQNQIRSLTSGTSASHNRIRTSELANVLIPIASSNSELDARIKAIVNDYKTAIIEMSSSAAKVAQARNCERDIFGKKDDNTQTNSTSSFE